MSDDKNLGGWAAFLAILFVGFRFPWITVAVFMAALLFYDLSGFFALILVIIAGFIFFIWIDALAQKISDAPQWYDKKYEEDLRRSQEEYDEEMRRIEEKYRQQELREKEERELARQTRREEREEGRKKFFESIR